MSYESVTARDVLGCNPKASTLRVEIDSGTIAVA